MRKHVEDDRLAFTVKHVRPVRLRNGGCCWSDETVAEILRKPDTDLDWGDYRVLYTISRCVGSFEELVYFLPRAFSYVIADSAEGHECTSQILYFISKEREALRAEDLDQKCRAGVQAWLEHWTESFVVHTSASTCDDCPHRYVPNSDIVESVLDHLLTYETHADLAERFVQELAESGGAVRSAWFLEYAAKIADRIQFYDSGEHQRAWVELGRPTLESELATMQSLINQVKPSLEPPDQNPFGQVRQLLGSLFTARDIPAETSPTVMGLITDRQLLAEKLRIVLLEMGQTTPPGYWKDLGSRLHLHD